jgi:hypothetical protein
VFTEIGCSKVDCRKATTSCAGPVGLFIVRKDGAAGSKLAEEVVGSFGYWNFRSGFAFDGVFLGWAFDGVPVFRHEMFVRCLDDLELALDWT